MNRESHRFSGWECQNIAYYVREASDHEVSGQAVSKYLYGQPFIEAFADALELTPEERIRLAWIYTYEPQ